MLPQAGKDSAGVWPGSDYSKLFSGPLHYFYYSGNTYTTFYSVYEILNNGGIRMKVVVLESPAFLGFFLRKLFKIKKEEKKE